MANTESMRRAAARMEKREQDLKQEKKDFLKKFPFGKTHDEQKKAHEGLVDLVLRLCKEVEDLSHSSSLRGPI